MIDKIYYRNHPCQTCGYYHNRGVSIDALIIIKNRLLLVKRKSEPFRNYWALPGGYLEYNESLEEAVRREVIEETGLKVTNLQYLNIYSEPERHPDQVIAVAYIVKVQGVERAGDDAGELKYYDLEDIPEKLAFNHHKIISDYLRQSQ